MCVPVWLPKPTFCSHTFALLLVVMFGVQRLRGAYAQGLELGTSSEQVEDGGYSIKL